MDRIDKAIEFYLASDDDRAFQIDGPWGTGKTYYVQNTAKKIIEENGYRTIYVSLSNMQDLAEIKSEVSVQILATLGTTKQAGYQATKIAASSLELIKNLGFSQAELLKQPAKEFGKKIRAHLLKNIDYTKCVFIFDDLERMSEQLDIQQVFGYIASLLEQNHSKVIIISNQEKYAHLDDLLDKKEKVINKTISFSGDNLSVACNIIKQKLSESLSTEQCDDIFSLSRELLESDEDVNLRTIKSIMSSFKQVADPLKDPKLSLSPKDLNHDLEVALVSIWILTQEYKRGSIKPSDNFNPLFNQYFINLRENYSSIFGVPANDEKNDKVKEEIKLIIKKYNRVISDFELDLDILFPDTIYYLVINDFFNVNDFLSILGKKKGQKSQSQSKVLPIVKDINILDKIQNDQELIDSEKKLINLIDTPDSDIIDLIMIYQCFAKLSERKLPIDSDYDAKKLISKIRIGVNECNANQLSAIKDQFLESSSDNGFKKRIKSFVDDRQKQINEETDLNNMNIILLDQWNQKKKGQFPYFSSNSLFQLLMDNEKIKEGTFLKTEAIRGLSSYLKYEINSISNANQYYKNEIKPGEQFLLGLKEFGQSISVKDHQVQSFLLSRLEETITYSINHLKEPSN